MTYQEIVNRVQSVVNAHYMLKDFGYGDLSDLKTRFENTSGDASVQADYPYLFLNPANHVRNLTTMTYNFNMIVMDMARGEVADIPYDNFLTIQSQCQEYIDDVLAALYYDFTDQPEVMTTNISYQVFKDRFQDVVAGMTCSLSIVVPTGLNACIAPIDKEKLEPTQPIQELVVAVNSEDRTVDPDVGFDDVFQYNINVYNPTGAWEINKFVVPSPGTYKILVEQQITLNEPAIGETVPSQPVINQLSDLGNSDIPSLTSQGWPTDFVDTETVYNYTAEWIISVPTITPTTGYVWQFVLIPDTFGQPDSSLNQLAGGIIKIAKL